MAVDKPKGYSIVGHIHGNWKQWGADEKKFREDFPIVKDVGSIIARGVWVEEVLDRLQTGDCYEAGIGTAFFDAEESGSIPTLLVGCQSQQQWVEVKNYLRAMGLLR